MAEKLDFSDMRILEGLGLYGPRNSTELARKLNLPREMLRKRLRRMSSHFSLRFHANIYHTNLGLKKAFVIAEAIPGYEDTLFECFKVNDFWIYVCRCYGMNEGCLGLYTVPKNHSDDFEQYFCLFEKLGVARNVKIFWSTCLQSVHSKCKWFNEQTGTWDFRWDEWIREIPLTGTQLPYTLIDPKDFPQKGDEIDVLILKELEKNPKITLVDLAKMFGKSQQFIEYHYRKHILRRGLLESFEVSFSQYNPAVSDLFLFIFRFDNNEKLARFLLSLLDKPFVLALGKILCENAAIADIYLPRSEFRNFIDALSSLTRAGILESYNYIIRDTRKRSRQTISYEYFKHGSWLYDHKKHIENLQNLVKQTSPKIKE